MKRIFKFGTLSDDIICRGIFISSFLIILRFVYLSHFSISIYDSNARQFIFGVLHFYIRYLEPIVIFIWLKFICEFLFKCLKS